MPLWLLVRAVTVSLRLALDCTGSLRDTESDRSGVMVRSG